jgi:hypothetical protein
LEHVAPEDPRYGDLDKRVFRNIFKQHLMEIVHCYEAHLPANADARKLVIRFMIDGSGNVQEASVKGGAPDANRCVAFIISQIKFPHPPDGLPLRITYPLWIDAAGN